MQLNSKMIRVSIKGNNPLYVNVGSNYNNEGKAGAFYFNANNTVSNSNSNISSRLISDWVLPFATWQKLFIAWYSHYHTIIR